MSKSEKSGNNSDDGGGGTDENNSIKMKNLNKNKSTTSVPAADESTKLSSRAITLFYQFFSMLDFNLKFKNTDLENVFLKSYLSVTRLIFIKYLFYLILFTLTWLVYLILNAALPGQGTQVLLDTSCEAEKYSAAARSSNTTAYGATVHARFMGDLYMLILLMVMTFI